MTGFFVETSALAKLYHKEPGRNSLNACLRTSNRFFISRLSLVEMESVLSTKIRVGEISQSQAATARRRLAADLERRRIDLGPPLHERHFQTAAQLLVNHGATSGLRTLDAIQLGIALDLLKSGLFSVVVASDHRLCRVAELAGRPSLDPADPGPLVA